MYFVGLDLAWGQKRPTGLAVLDEGGHLVRLSAHGTDEDILSSVGPYTEGRCMVAIDAPLVVRNAVGNRPCEAELNRDFAKFDAGAHPSNTSKAEFADEPRGARLAHALGLDMDPDSEQARRAIEVYPHPATVALFHLGRTLKYKNKPGRTLPQLRSELLELMRLVEGLADAEIPLHVHDNVEWKSLVELAASATRKSELRRAEDQVDAVICAYVGLFAERRPGSTKVYGDLDSGYIVTPALPVGLVPSPRAAKPAPVPDEDERVRSAVQRYAELLPELQKATDAYVALVTTLLDDAGINYLSVTGRTKSVASFAIKAGRTHAGRPLFADPLSEITDQLGVRVITYLHSDVTAVADLLGDQFSVLDDRDLGQETASEGRFGYASRHLLIALDDGRPVAAAYDVLSERRAQVQVRTVLQHAWAEFEHAIRYKGTIPEEHVTDLDRRFTLAAGLLELADREFTEIRDRLQATVPEQSVERDATDPRISAQDLATFLTNQYADAGWSRPDHYQWVAGLLLELGITSLEELGELLGTVDSAAIDAQMGYRYPAGAVRRLDDALLWLYGTRYVTLHGNAHRTALLQARLEKLRTGNGD
jgi:predicted RNase H-like nuclease/ppGpp synthetase/RelA/SpoT-type nucleotidyltranferase